MYWWENNMAFILGFIGVGLLVIVILIVILVRSDEDEG